MEYIEFHKCIEVNFTPAKTNCTFKSQDDLNVLN